MSDLDPHALKVAELRDELKNRGLDTKGNKAALVSRLKEALGYDAIIYIDVPGDGDPDALKVAELRDELKNRGLDTKGNKAALVSRLKEALDYDGTGDGDAIAVGEHDDEDETGDADEEEQEEESANYEEDAQHSATGENYQEEQDNHAEENGAEDIETGDTTADEVKAGEEQEGNGNMEEEEPAIVLGDENPRHRGDTYQGSQNEEVLGKPRRSNHSGEWRVLFDKATKCLNRFNKTAACKKRNYIVDQTNVYASSQRRKMQPFEGFQHKAVVILSPDEVYKNRVKERLEEERKDIPESAVNAMKASFSIPEDGEYFESIEYVEELSKEDRDKLAEQYRKEGREALPPPEKRERRESRDYRDSRRTSSYRGGYDREHRGGYRGSTWRRYSEHRGEPGKVNPVNKCLKKSDVSAERCKYRSSAVNRHNAITSKTTIQAKEEEEIQVLGKPRRSNHSGEWRVLFDKATKCLNRFNKTAACKKRNYIVDQTNVYASSQRRKMQPFEGFQHKAVVILSPDEVYKNRVKERLEEERKDIPESAVNAMKASFSIPEDGEYFESIEYVEELSKEDRDKLAEQYRKEGREALPPPEKRERRESRDYRDSRRTSSYRGGYDREHRGGYRGSTWRRYSEHRGDAIAVGEHDDEDETGDADEEEQEEESANYEEDAQHSATGENYQEEQDNHAEENGAEDIETGDTTADEVKAGEEQEGNGNMEEEEPAIVLGDENPRHRGDTYQGSQNEEVLGKPRRSNHSGEWRVLFDKATKCLNRFNKTAACKKRNYIVDQTNVYASSQRRKMQPFEGFQHKAVVILSPDEVYKNLVKERLEEERKDIPESAVNAMKASFSIPEDGEYFESIEYVEELSKEDRDKLAEQYRKEGREALPPPEKRERRESRDYRDSCRTCSYCGGYDREPRGGYRGSTWRPDSEHRGGGYRGRFRDGHYYDDRSYGYKGSCGGRPCSRNSWRSGGYGGGRGGYSHSDWDSYDQKYGYDDWDDYDRSWGGYSDRWGVYN